MSEGEPRDPLRELGRRLDGARKTLGDKKARGDAGPDTGSLALAWRVGIELVGAILVSTVLC